MLSPAFHKGERDEVDFQIIKKSAFTNQLFRKKSDVQGRIFRGTTLLCQASLASNCYDGLTREVLLPARGVSSSSSAVFSASMLCDPILS